MPQLCECGCGQPAPIAKRNRPERGYLKGQPQRFIQGHWIKHGRYQRARGRGHMYARYGLTKAQYYQLLATQEGRCAICDQLMKRPQIDHDHDTGAVRGLLCSFCNHSLEWAETYETQRKAYLGRAQCQD